MVTRPSQWHAPTLSLLLWIAVAHGTLAQEQEPFSEEMTELNRYIGSWTSDEKATQDGKKFTFRYQLEWFDQHKSMAKMTITQEFSDGKKQLLWEGFKGWNPMTETTFYYGFSPSGRAGFGSLRREGNLLHTEYSGKGPRAQGLEIRDTFTPTGKNSFRSETYLLRDGEWQKVTEDLWTRAG